MATEKPARQGAPKTPIEDRRAPASATGTGMTLRKLKGALGRPIALERRDGQLHVVLVERRRQPRDDQPLTLRQMCTELRARLLTNDADHPVELTRQLVVVHDVLSQRGWKGVEALKARILSRALMQAEDLAREEPSRALRVFMERLRVAQVAAQIREERGGTTTEGGATGAVQVTEATAEEFEAIERGWVGTVPSATSVEPPEAESGREPENAGSA